MGGGTSVVEGILAGRQVVGNDLNSLAVFIAEAKITALSDNEEAAVRDWADYAIPTFGYHRDRSEVEAFIDLSKTTNMNLPKARFIKKGVAAALASITELPGSAARRLAKCALLQTGQCALDGRIRHTSLSEFRSRLAHTAKEMLASLKLFVSAAHASGGSAKLLNMDAASLDKQPMFANTRKRAALVITSPPYPGVHVLYHRWQVDGRRETPAPYWIAGCNDGQGASFYNFGDRRQAAADNYFRTSLATLHAIRAVMRDGGHMVQMVAFNKADEQLPRYLENMKVAGFCEVPGGDSRIWRQVPQRKWHATFIGKTDAANEVVLVHRAV